MYFSDKGDECNEWGMFGFAVNIDLDFSEN